MQFVFRITIRARPNPGSVDDDDAGGAYVNAFVNCLSETEAVEVATRLVREADWIVEGIDDVCRLSRNDIDESDPEFGYFDQAIVDREVAVFHTWPNEPQEEDTKH